MPSHDEILLFTSPEQFQSRKGYVAELVATQDELDRIVGKTAFPAPRSAWLKCGLNACDEPHRRGYVIRLHDGRETHCGNRCGFLHFGVKWEEMEARAKAVETATATRNAIEALLARKTELTQRALALVTPCLHLEEKLEQLRLELGKHQMLWRLVEQCARLDGSIRVAIEAPPGAGGHSRSRSALLRTIGHIDGARLLLHSATKHSNVITKSVLPALHALNSDLLQAAVLKELQAHSRSGAALTESLDRADRTLRDGSKLLTAENLKRIDLVVQHQLASKYVTPQLRASLDKAYRLAN